MSKKIVYTCITGDYDELVDHQFVNPDWEYICFSDKVKSSDKNSSWSIMPLQHLAADNPRTNRWHKINPHLFLKNYTYSIYVDANIDILDNSFFDEINKQVKQGSKFSLMLHPVRDCIYDEIKACISLNLDDLGVMRKQIEIFKKDKFPKHNGLFANGILLREHMDKQVSDVMNDWWYWVNNYSRRDQLSLQYVLWKHDYKPVSLPYKFKRGLSGALFFYPHISGSRDYIKILSTQVNDLTRKINITDQQLIDTREQLRQMEKLVNLRKKNRLMRLLAKS